MTPEEKRQGAFEQFGELLTEGASVDDAIIRTAEDNELKADVFRTIAEQQFGDLGEYSQKLHLRRVTAATSAEVKLAMSKRHPANIFRDCYDLDEVAARVQQRLGRPITAAEVSRIEEVHRDFVMNRIKNLAEDYR